MAQQDNLAKVKAGYAAWNDHKGNSLDVWREIMDESFHITSMAEGTAGLAFAVDRKSREGSLKYLAGIFDEWEMVHYTPEIFVSDGENVSMFGKCAYRYKKTGKVAECRVANLWRFKDGKAIELTDVWDTAAAARAAI